LSTSPLLFARDGRTLPFIPVTVAAMRAIRERITQRRPVAVATYMTLLELANEDRTDRVAVTQKELTQRVGAGRTSVQQALADLQDAGVLIVRERHHGGARLENEYVVIEPDQAVSDTAPPPATRATPRSPDGQGSLATRAGVARPAGSGPLKGEEGTKKEEEARADPRDQPPEDFPDELKPHARIVMATLRRIAAQHNAPKVWPLAVGRAVMQHPRHPLVKVANAFELWAVSPPRPIKDVVATYRTFLEREHELQSTERLAADGIPLNGNGRSASHSVAEPSTGSAKLRGMAADLRAGAKPQ
jgi:biotin operon repressor